MRSRSHDSSPRFQRLSIQAGFQKGEKMDIRKDYYAVLGVHRTETEPRIHGAYRRLAKECHPDRTGDQDTRKFQEIQEAYEILSDPEKRGHYDRHFSPTWSRRPAEPLVQSRAASFGEPEPLIPNDWSHIEQLVSAPSTVCRYCGTRNFSVASPCRSCFSGASLEEAMAEIIAQYLHMARREWL